MKEYTAEDIERIEQLADEGNREQCLREIEGMHPADIAELFQSLDLKQAEWFFELIPDREMKADVLMELDEEERKKLLEGMDPEQIGHFIDLLDTDDAVDLIQELDEEDREEVIHNIEDVEQAGDIVDLLQYDEDTAGGLMGTELISVNENLSMPDCLREMRHQAEDLDDIYYIYVVDDDNRLKGVLPLKKMITHPSVSKIKHVMESDPVSVKVDMPIEEVAIDFEKYDLVAMPVVDSIGRLVGQITVDDVMDQVREQSERDYQLASGIASDVDADDSVLAQTRARLPWLLIGIAGGLLSSVILSGFEAQLAAVTALAYFIPLIGGTGGNVGHRGAGSRQRPSRPKGILAPALEGAQDLAAQRSCDFRGCVPLHDVYRAWRLGSDRGGGFLALPDSGVLHGVRRLGASHPREAENKPGARHGSLYTDYQ